jgi:DNA-binding transcriptional LysR family regulator
VNGIDLNLLAVLGALLEERNLTRAGARLSVSQPAMSGALARLRQHFGDELLVRSGRQHVLTPMATVLLPAVQEALRQMERTLSAPLEFDPATSTRRFSIAVSAQSILALSELLARVHAAAPRVAIETWPITTALLDGGRPLLCHDLLIGPAGLRAGGEPEVILRDRLVYVADPANPRLRDGRLTIADLAALPHAAARLCDPAPPWGQSPVMGGSRPPSPLADTTDTGPGPATAALERLGLTPAVVLTTAGWLPLPFLVAGTDMIAAVPERLARRLAGAAGVTVIEPPFGPIEVTETAWWHPMRATDPALTWLRAILRETADRIEADDADEITVNHEADG